MGILSDKKIEYVARRICKACLFDPDTKMYHVTNGAKMAMPPDTNWPDIDYTLRWEMFKPQAVAAIKAIDNYTRKR